MSQGSWKSLWLSLEGLLGVMSYALILPITAAQSRYLSVRTDGRTAGAAAVLPYEAVWAGESRMVRRLSFAQSAAAAAGRESRRDTAARAPSSCVPETVVSCVDCLQGKTLH